MVPPRSNRVSRAPPYSRTRKLPYPYRAVTVCGAPFQALPVRSLLATGLIRVRSPLLAESQPPAHRAERLWLLSFPPATEMFQFAGFASPSYGFTRRYRLSGGLPHSDIRGSPGARPSPRLFAACHVLHRLSVPRHPPDALVVRRPRPAPSTRLCRVHQAACRTQRTAEDAACCRLLAAVWSRCARTAPPLLAQRHFAYPCPGPTTAPTRGHRSDLLHGHNSLHDVNRTPGQRSDHRPDGRSRISVTTRGHPMPTRRARNFRSSVRCLGCHLSSPTPVGGPGPI